MTHEEIFDLVDEEGRIIGQAPRRLCHGNPDLLHAVVHVMVINDNGEIFLQKRHRSKDIQPGKWDTAVGGHMQPGESPLTAAYREMEEEIGTTNIPLLFAYRYIWRTSIESELVHTFIACHNGPFVLQDSEIEDGRFWKRDEIEQQDNHSLFTPNFIHEYKKYFKESCQHKQLLQKGH
jgi:isopentenyldiphosphate isomerase